MKRLFLLLFVFIVYATASAQKLVPELWGLHVHDEAKILTAQTVQKLENELKVFEDSTTNQIAILIIESLEGEVLENYSLKVSEAWKLGNKNNDNGVLLLISINDKKMRIEVGQGLEGVLTDALTNRIVRNEIAPAFRRQDYDAGVSNGVYAIMQGTKGEYKNTEVASGNRRKGKSGGSVLLMLIIFIVISIISRIRGGGNRRGGGWSSGAGWFGAGMMGGMMGGSNRGGGFGGFSGGGGSFGGGGSSGSW
jgi:uncharacterized protein